MSRAGWRDRAAMLGVLGLLIGALGVLQLGGAEPGLLYLAPALLLLGTLIFGRYPGERLLTAFARTPHLALRLRGHLPPRPLSARTFPRGGVLLAMALAGRGPPG